MTGSQAWLAGGTLAGTAVVVLAIWALVWNRRRTEAEVLLLGYPTGDVLVSLASLGVIGALAFSGFLDAKVAGTLLGAHLGYHAAASGRNRSRPTPSEQSAPSSTSPPGG
jgi:O-antigen/teichoic acid export membrane protein